jgi:hypothetical protein
MKSFHKFLLLSSFLALTLISTAQNSGPIHPYSIRNLGTKAGTTTIISNGYFPYYYNGNAYKMKIVDIKTNIASTTVRDSLELRSPYKSWQGLLTQSSTNAPTATVLQNTTGGTITWSYTSAGLYVGELSVNILTATSTFALITPTVVTSSVYFTRLSDSTFNIKTYADGGAGADAVANALLTATPFELRIYH